MESLYLTTSDNIKISANQFLPERKKYPKPRGWAIFLHMMPATKESWKQLADHLQQAGYTGLAIDFRGHGTSDGGPFGYREFSDEEHQGSVRDVQAAIDIVHALGANDERIVLIGASIGANLALQYAHDHRSIASVVAISPGLDYHGIVTEPLVSGLSTGKRLLFIGSHDDERALNSEADIDALCDVVPSGVLVEKQIVEGKEHGTNILVHNPELMDDILTFLEQ